MHWSLDVCMHHISQLFEYPGRIDGYEVIHSFVSGAEWKQPNLESEIDRHRGEHEWHAVTWCEPNFHQRMRVGWMMDVLGSIHLTWFLSMKVSYSQLMHYRNWTVFLTVSMALLALRTEMTIVRYYIWTPGVSTFSFFSFHFPSFLAGTVTMTLHAFLLEWGKVSAVELYLVWKDKTTPVSLIILLYDNSRKLTPAANCGGFLI